MDPCSKGSLGKLALPQAEKIGTPRMGGAVAEWSKALLVRENKRKSKRSQVRPRPGHLLKKPDI